PIVIAKFWSLRTLRGFDSTRRLRLLPCTFAHNGLIRRCLLRRPAGRLSLGGRRLAEPFTSCRIKRHLLGHLTTHCRTRRNSLASKIVRLLSESLYDTFVLTGPVSCG